MHIDLDSAVNNWYASLPVPINSVYLTELKCLLFNSCAKFAAKELYAYIVIQKQFEPLRIDCAIRIKYANEDLIDARRDY